MQYLPMDVKQPKINQFMFNYMYIVNHNYRLTIYQKQQLTE